jgi:hypothetical protein
LHLVAALAAVGLHLVPALAGFGLDLLAPLFVAALAAPTVVPPLGLHLVPALAGVGLYLVLAPLFVAALAAPTVMPAGDLLAPADPTALAGVGLHLVSALLHGRTALAGLGLVLAALGLLLLQACQCQFVVLGGESLVGTVAVPSSELGVGCSTLPMLPAQLLAWAS